MPAINTNSVGYHRALASLTPGRAGGRGEARGRSAASTKSLDTRLGELPLAALMHVVRRGSCRPWTPLGGAGWKPHAWMPPHPAPCALPGEDFILFPFTGTHRKPKEFCGSSQIAEPDDGLRDPLACPDFKAKKALPALINFYSQVLFFTLKSPFWLAARLPLSQALQCNLHKRESLDGLPSSGVFQTQSTENFFHTGPLRD